MNNLLLFIKVVEGFPKLSNTSFLTEVWGGFASFLLDSPSKIAMKISETSVNIKVTSFISLTGAWGGYLALVERA